MAWQLTWVQTVTYQSNFRMWSHVNRKTQFCHAFKHCSHAHSISISITWSCECRHSTWWLLFVLLFSRRTNSNIASMSRQANSHSWKNCISCPNPVSQCTVSPHKMSPQTLFTSEQSPPAHIILGDIIHGGTPTPVWLAEWDNAIAIHLYTVWTCGSCQAISPIAWEQG